MHKHVVKSQQFDDCVNFRVTEDKADEWHETKNDTISLMAPNKRIDWSAAFYNPVLIIISGTLAHCMHCCTIKYTPTL